MRGRFACAILLGTVGVVAANAADFSGGRSIDDNYGGYSSFGGRMEPLIVYDFEPGVIVRTYWYPPWQNRHYFPTTGRRPKVGRREHIPAGHISKAQEYYRSWSVSSVFFPGGPGGYAPQYNIPSAPTTRQPY